MGKRSRLIALCVTLLVSFSFAATQYDIYNAPTISNTHSVQFFYLEAPFPYNTPEQIIDAAGSDFNRYGIAHAGLGVWDTTSDYKYSIEFASESYVGGLLPTIANGVLTWNNAGNIVITYPLDESLWLNARLICTTSGSSYSQLITYLQDNVDIYSTFQPVTGLFVNSTLLNTTAGEVQSADLNTIGTILVPSTDSFTFVDDLISQLNSYGVNLGAFLQIYATSFTYLAATSNSAQVITWNSATANSNVYNWYGDLNTCYNNVFAATQQSEDGAQYFSQAIKSCYGEYAYIYRSASSVYNISLANDSSSYRTPYQSQYVYTLPSGGGGDNETLSITDYVVITLVSLGIIIGMVYFIRKVLGKKMRRRVSFEGERLAARTVDNLIESQEDRTYFHGKQYGQTFLGRLSGTFTRDSYKQSSVDTISSTSANPLQQPQLSSNKIKGGSSPLERPLTTGGYPTEDLMSETVLFKKTMSDFYEFFFSQKIGGRLKATMSDDDDDDNNNNDNNNNSDIAAVHNKMSVMSRENMIDDEEEV